MEIRQTVTSYGSENRKWARTTKGFQTCRTGTLDVSKFATNFADGTVPSGVTLGQITATRLWGPYDDTASDGRQVMKGVLFTTENHVVTGTTHVVAIQTEGDIYTDLLPTHHGLDANGQTDVGSRFTFTTTHNG